jgi:hypothetical protein
LLHTLIAAAIGLLSVRTMSTPILNMGIILTGGPLPSKEREVLAESQPFLLPLPGLQGCWQPFEDGSAFNSIHTALSGLKTPRCLPGPNPSSQKRTSLLHWQGQSSLPRRNTPPPTIFSASPPLARPRSSARFQKFALYRTNFNYNIGFQFESKTS